MMNLDPEHAKKMVMVMVKVGMVLWLIGFIMILSAIYMEFWGSYSLTPDNVTSKTLMTLKLGGIGFTLSGIFLSLVAIVKVLAIMPVNLAKVIKKKK